MQQVSLFDPSANYNAVCTCTPHGDELRSDDGKCPIHDPSPESVTTTSVPPDESFSTIIMRLNPPEPGIDTSQWGDQLKAVYSVMKDHRWRSLAELAYQSGHPEASVSARLRDLRKKGHIVHRRRAKEGKLYEYQVFR